MNYTLTQLASGVNRCRRNLPAKKLFAISLTLGVNRLKNLPTLDPSACRTRQERLLEILAEKKLDGALLTDARHVHYFSGFWTPSIFPAALWVSRDGEAILSAAVAPTHPIAAEFREYQSSHLATLIDDLPAAALEPLRPLLQGARLGCESFPPTLRSGAFEIISPRIQELRRAKDADEIGMIRHAIAAADALYQRARQILQPGANENWIYAQLYAAAIEGAGEEIGILGNNFQSKTGGATPRDRAIEAGELWALDISVPYRGYRCDLCRTLCIGGEPTSAQKQAHARVWQALQWFEANARAGESCRELYQSVFEQLDGFNGWKFPHHLGHGIGLGVHEAPRLNPHWDDTLQVGDVIAVEPGLYGPDLRDGVRLEDDFWVTPNGLEKLSTVDWNL